MQNQHQKLCKTLQKTYFLRILSGIIIFTFVFLYFSCIFTTTYVEYHVQATSSLSTLKDVIKSAQLTMTAIINALSQQIKTNRTVSNTNNYCSHKLSYSECVLNMNKNTANKLIQDRQNTSISFRCLKGECTEAAVLWDYFWVFKLRNTFINYIVLNYKYQNNSQNSLIVPALASASNNQIKQSQSQWLLSYNKSQLCLSHQKIQDKITGKICFDNYVMTQKYKIMLDDYRLAPQQRYSGEPNIIYSYRSPPQTYRFDIIPLNLATLIGLIAIMVFSHLSITKIVEKWQRNNFKHIQALQIKYHEQLKQIFNQQQPRNSAILNQGTLECFYEDLSEIVDTSCSSLSEHYSDQEQLQKFKYLPLLEKIKIKFEATMKTLQQQKVSLVNHLRYQLKGSISEIAESVSKKLKQNFTRAKQMHLTTAFFYFGYLSLLMSNIRFEQRLRTESFPIPGLMLELFRYMNTTINSEDIKFAFKFAFSFTKNIQEELVMRIHCSLQHRYLALIKQLDFGSHFAIQLGLERELKYLQDSIQNKKHILFSYLK